MKILFQSEVDLQEFINELLESFHHEVNPEDVDDIVNDHIQKHKNKHEFAIVEKALLIWNITNSKIKAIQYVRKMTGFSIPNSVGFLLDHADLYTEINEMRLPVPPNYKPKPLGEYNA